MSTLPLNAPRVPVFPATGLSRVAAAVVTLFEVMTEAQEMAREAHKKYPFAEW